MTTLILRRHSTKDGPQDTIGPKGLLLARREGDNQDVVDPEVDHIFHGPLVRTAQTALAFAGQMGCKSVSYPVVDGLGSAAMFGDMVTDAFKAGVKSGKSNFVALIETHGVERCQEWAVRACLPAVEGMFDILVDEDVGIGFFHSPTIELAAWAVAGCPDIKDFPAEYAQLGDLEGVTFYRDDEGAITLGDKISVEPLSAEELAEAGIAS